MSLQCWGWRMQSSEFAFGGEDLRVAIDILLLLVLLLWGRVESHVSSPSISPVTAPTHSIVSDVREADAVLALRASLKTAAGLKVRACCAALLLPPAAQHGARPSGCE